MAEISVIIRTADQTRKAEVAMEDSSAAKDVIDTMQQALNPDQVDLPAQTEEN